MIGRRLYELFFEGYTRKQWGVSADVAACLDPEAAPASVQLRRLVLQSSRTKQFPPRVTRPSSRRSLIMRRYTVTLNTALAPRSAGDYDHVIWSGPLDAFFNYDLGRLSYRTLDFEEFVADGDFQGTPVMNYGDEQVPYTRITEHKHFAPAETHDQTVCFREFSREHQPDDIPYYPVRLVDDKELLDEYEARAETTDGVTFVGRLGTYRYLDMDVTIAEALEAADRIRVLL